MLRSVRGLAITALFITTGPVLAAPLPTVSRAEDSIFQAFQTHPLVGMQEVHGLAQELDFYSALIRDPRFAREVGNVVLEVGDAAYQDIVDRYVNGENVPYAELRRVWADGVGFSPTVASIGSINVYDTIRSVNMKLPSDGRIKVWLGDPPTDWSKIKTKADLVPLENQRNSYPAELIEREILGKNRKALVIYGTDHLRLGIYTNQDNLLARVEKANPGAFFVVWPYVGYATPACAAPFERHIKNWPIPALVTPIRGSSFERDIYRPGCGIFVRPPNMTEEQYDLLMRDYTGLMSDALLYLGPRAQQVCSPGTPDIYLDLDFRSELERRNQLRFGEAITGHTAHENIARQPFWPKGRCAF
jgi:hypothetical protein